MDAIKPESNRTSELTDKEPHVPEYTHRIYSSDAEDHYKTLTALFKDMLSTAQTVVTITVVVMGIVIGIGLAFSYKSVADVKAEVKQSVDGIKSELKESANDLRSNTKQALDSTVESSRLARSDAKESVEQTNKTTEAQIAQIRERAASVALNEAQKRVDSAFQGDRIQTMIESSARAQVAPVIERQLKGAVDSAIDSVQVDLEWLTKILDASGYMRQGSREGMERLRQIRETAPSDKVRQRADFLFNTIAKEYEDYEKSQLTLGGFKTALDSYGDAKNRPQLVSQLVATILKEPDIHIVAVATLALREKTGQPFRMFDVEAVRQWCLSHSSQCPVN